MFLETAVPLLIELDPLLELLESFPLILDDDLGPLVEIIPDLDLFIGSFLFPCLMAFLISSDNCCSRRLTSLNFSGALCTMKTV